MASYMLAIQIRSLDAQADIGIITKTDGRYYPKPLLSTAIYHKKKVEDIVTETAAGMADKYQIRVYTKEEVIDIHTDQKSLETHTGKRFTYNKLVFATGSNPISLQLPNGGEEHIYQVNALEDYERLTEALRDKKSITIVGSGLVGVEFAHDLVQAGYRVRVLSLEPYPLAGLVPSSISEQLKSHLLQLGVTWVTGALTGIQKHQSSGYTLSTDNASYEADIVLGAVGIKANIDLAQKSGLTCSHAIEVDTSLKSNKPDIYALGDAATIGPLHLTYVAPIKQQAKALAHTLLGQETNVHYPAMPVVVKVPTLPLTLVPVRGNVEGAWEDQPWEDDQGVISVFYNKSHVVCGFALVGTATRQRNTWLEKMSNLLEGEA